MHKGFLSCEGGRYKVYCSCGAQSKGKLGTELEAREAHREHKEHAKAVERSKSLVVA